MPPKVPAGKNAGMVYYLMIVSINVMMEITSQEMDAVLTASKRTDGYAIPTTTVMY